MGIQDATVDLSRTLIQKGPKFRSHTIVFNEETAHLKPTISSLLFCVIYIIVGLFLVALAAVVYAKSHQLDLTSAKSGGGDGR